MSLVPGTDAPNPKPIPIPNPNPNPDPNLGLRTLAITLTLTRTRALTLDSLRAKLAGDRACNPNAATQPDCGCDTCTLIVQEESITTIELRGLNQALAGTATERLDGTDFVIRNLPSNGRLYQYDESATGKRATRLQRATVSPTRESYARLPLAGCASACSTRAT